MLAVRASATLADVAAAPEGVRAELIEGTLYTQPRPAGPHTRVASLLGMEVGSPFDRGRGGPGGWVILDEPELHLGSRPDVAVPDLAGWRVERFEGAGGKFFTVAPDWVCEVASPSTRGYDRLVKLRLYARVGVPFVWIVDPESRFVEVLELGSSRAYVIVGGAGDDAAARLQPFDAVPLDLAAMWAAVGP